MPGSKFQRTRGQAPDVERGNPRRFTAQLAPSSPPEPPGVAIGEASEAPAGLALAAHGLGVRFHVSLTKRRTLRDSIQATLHRRPSRATVWALRDVDIEVARGQAVGLIGANGAGKSTLMLALAGILQPDEGSLQVDGRVSALLSLGAGFSADLSGRENVDLALAYMGIEGRDARELTPGIVEFADLGQFIEAPAKTYSAGMRARLGFAIATSIDPEILLIDEVLSTGDQEFRARSRERIDELVAGARAAVIVSHDLAYVAEQCSTAVWLDAGRVAGAGEPSVVVAAYRDATQCGALSRRDTGFPI